MTETGSQVDLLVIGGGITGAGIARDAALRGLSVQLLEQYDFAHGASSRSSKLIHGGLRYLEQGTLGLVHEACRERARLHRQLPHLVTPLRILFPVYRDARRPRWQVRLGVALYDLLAAGRRIGQSRSVSAEAIRDTVPGLRSKHLRGGVEFFDCQMDDARLCLEVLRDAVHHGAHCHSYRRLEGLRREGPGWRGDWVGTGSFQEEGCIRARMVINASGAWSDQARQKLLGCKAPALRTSRGTHLVLAGALVPHGILLPTCQQDERVVFVLPYADATLIGTTDAAVEASAQFHTPSPDEIEYLRTNVTHYFPDATDAQREIHYAFAGTRPLAAPTRGGALSRTPREHRVFDEDGVVSIIGGKYTTFGVMAADALDHALTLHGVAADACRSHDVAYQCAPTGGEVDALIAAGISAPTANAIAARYGGRATEIAALVAAEPSLAEGVPDAETHILAEVEYASRKEWARTLDDVLSRRTGMTYRAGISQRTVEAVARQMCAAGVMTIDEANAQITTWCAARSASMQGTA